MRLSIPVRNHVEERELICMKSKNGWCDNPRCYDDAGKCPYGDDEEGSKFG